MAPAHDRLHDLGGPVQHKIGGTLFKKYYEFQDLTEHEASMGPSGHGAPSTAWYYACGEDSVCYMEHVFSKGAKQ